MPGRGWSGPPARPQRPLLCSAVPPPDRQAEAAVLVDHVQELEPPPVSGGVELKVHGPHLVWVFGLVAPHRAVGGPGPLALPGDGPLQTLLPPEPLHPLVIHAPAFPPQQAAGHPPAPADLIGGDLAETMPQLSLLDRDDLWRMALSAAVLPHHSAHQPFRCPVTLLQDRDGPPAALRPQKFPSARSLSIAFSSCASASSFLSRAFSFSG